MPKAGKLKSPVVDVLYSRSLEECVESVLGPHDLGGANPYLPENHEKSFPLGEIMYALKAHPTLIGKRPRRQSDRLRGTLNGMISIRRVGSTRKARYSFDSKAKAGVGTAVLKLMMRALLQRNGRAKWKELQKDLKVAGEMEDDEGQITHLNFNSALNYLADNGILEKKGQRPEQLPPDPETGALSTTKDTREIICTPKAWGWEPSVVEGHGETQTDGYAGKDDGAKDAETQRETWEKIGGSRKQTHSITLTSTTSDLLEELEVEVANLAEADSRRPANINRSTIIEVALWMLRRDISNFDESREMPSEFGGIDLATLARHLADYMSNQRSYI